MHNLLFCAHTLCMNYVSNTFLLVSSSVSSKQLLGSLSMHVFETRTTIGRGHFACRDSGVFQIFIPSISNGKRYLVMQMRSCEDKLKGKTAHFRLPSASKKRACLSSLLCFVHGQAKKANKNLQQRTLSSFIIIPLY